MDRPVVTPAPSSASRSIVPCAVIGLGPHGLFTRIGAGSAVPDAPLAPEAALALEILLHEPSVERAAARYATLAGAEVPAALGSTLARLEELLDGAAGHMLRLARGALLLVERAQPRRDLTELSRGSAQILQGLALRRGLRPRPLDAAAFAALVDELRARRLLAPAPGHVDWGDLRAGPPICPRFGLTRGTPIDRYYLDRFVAAIRGEVRGDVVELGGRAANRELYGFSAAASYRGLDVHPAADLVGDAHDPRALPDASLDGIVAFNVLEHCREPWRVVANMRAWLRPGGKAFCMVPSVQRVHRMPADYWRPLPEALRALFAGWSAHRLYVYGNFVTTVAALAGIASEELEPAELDAEHPDYPVASCIAAVK